MPNEETMKSMQQEKRIEYKVLASDQGHIENALVVILLFIAWLKTLFVGVKKSIL